MENSRINEMMAAYSKNPSEEARQELVAETAAFVFSNLKRILAKSCPADEDAAFEFILWLYPQLERIIDRFDPKKASFATYVSVGVKFRYIRFCAERSRREEMRRAAESEEIKFCNGWYSLEKEPCACETSPSYIAPGNGDGASPPRCALELFAKTRPARKRLARDMLILTLKSTFYLSEELIEKVAAFCEVPREELDSLIESARRDYSKRQAAYEALRLQRYRYYIRAFACSERLKKIMLSCEALDSEKARAVKKERDFCEKQGERIEARMERMRRDPSNRYLAELLGLPRGSVDSSLARIKKRLYSSKDEDSPGDI